MKVTRLSFDASARFLAIFLILMGAAFAAPEQGELHVRAVRESDERPVAGAVVRLMNRAKNEGLGFGGDGFTGGGEAHWGPDW